MLVLVIGIDDTSQHGQVRTHSLIYLVHEYHGEIGSLFRAGADIRLINLHGKNMRSVCHGILNILMTGYIYACIVATDR